MGPMARWLLGITVLLAMGAGGAGGAGGDGEGGGGAVERSIRLLRPSTRDFVEVIQGGSLASDVVVELKNFVVPSDGYMMVEFLDSKLFLCPGIVYDLQDCDMTGKPIESRFAFTLIGIEMGFQNVCVSIHDWESNMLSNDCRGLVGSQAFPGPLETVTYFQDMTEEFLDRNLPRNILQKLLTFSSDLDPLVWMIRSEGSDLSQAHSKFSLPALSYHTVCLMCPVASNPIGFRALQDISQLKQLLLSDHDDGKLFIIDVEGDEVNFQEMFEPDDMSWLPAIKPVLLISLHAGREKPELKTLVDRLAGVGYHGFLVGTQRISILNGDMWSKMYEESVDTTDEGSKLLFAFMSYESDLYANILMDYNASGMTIGCAPRSMMSFHTPNGYLADDCPPNFNIYRTSRLKLFESALASGNRRLHPSSLLRYRRNVYSEAGEDGITEFIMEALGVKEGSCFEFGAWDGIFASNCRYWFEKGWSGIMIEADETKFRALQRNYRNLPRVALKNAMVEAKGNNSILHLAEELAEDGKVDILSIDVDGLDYELLLSLEHQPEFRPSLIIVETNGFIRPDLSSKLDVEASSHNLQQSLKVFQQLGEQLGYELVCFTQNAIFLRRDLAEELKRSWRLEPSCSVNRLYLDALSTNWNDMLLNIQATRKGATESWVQAEIREFGEFNTTISMETLEHLAREEERRKCPQALFEG